MQQLELKSTRNHKLARWLFAASGTYGVVVLLPLYFLEADIAKSSGAFAYPEYFYGFIGTAFAAQSVFFMIACDPSRFRPAMLFGVLEKLAFAVPVFVLFESARVASSPVVFGVIDLVWAVLFALSWLATGRALAETRA